MNSRISNFLCIGLLLTLFSPISFSAIQSYSAFINSDNINTGQCSVNTVSGIDYRITVDVDDSSFTINAVSLEHCSGAAFLAPEVLPASNWAVGVGNGVNGSTLIEGVIPKSTIGNPTQVSLIFTSDNGSGGFSDIVSSNNNNADPTWFVQIQQAIQNATPIPTLTNVGLIFLVLLIASLPFLLKKQGYLRNNAFSVIFMVPLLGVTIIALATTIIINGNSSDWPSNSLLTSDTSGDQTGVAGTDILNTYAFEDEQNLYVRLDVQITSVVTRANTISGVVDDDAPVSGAEVYIDFGDGITSVKAITNNDGSYELQLMSDDLEKINPEIQLGENGPSENILLVVKKDGKILRNALTRDVAEGQRVYITNDTEAYAQYLESIGRFNSIELTKFNLELDKGHIRDSSDMAEFIKDIREDVKSYFYGGEKPSENIFFTKAITHLGKERVALLADDSFYVSNRNVMSGGDIILPANVSVIVDEVSITAKGNGRYTLGNGNNSTQVVYLKIQNDNVFKLIPINLKARIITQLVKQTVIPEQGGILENVDSSFSATIPPFALNEEKELTFNKVDSDGGSTDGRVILEMKPSGLIFDMPITIKISYGEFGIDDPNAVLWKYGSVESGYENANIVSIDKINKSIYLRVTHFSDLVVQSISKSNFINLGDNFVKTIPRRNTLFIPIIDKYGSNETIIITNKLFTGNSLSNEKINSTMGGQCVQTARSFLWSFNYNQSGMDFSGDAEFYIRTGKQDDNLRDKFTDIETGDLIWENTGNIYGHTFTVFKDDRNKLKKDDKSQLRIVESNVWTLESYNDTPYKNDGKTGTQRIKLKDFLKKDGFCSNSKCAKKSKGKYIVLKNPDDVTHEFTDRDQKIANTAKSSYQIIDAHDKQHPSNYYLVNLIGNGVKKIGNKYKYNPDLLPVTPLKVTFDNKNKGRIESNQDSRYEIYAEKDKIDSVKIKAENLDVRKRVGDFYYVSFGKDDAYKKDWGWYSINEFSEQLNAFLVVNNTSPYYVNGKKEDGSILCDENRAGYTKCANDYTGDAEGFLALIKNKREILGHIDNLIKGSKTINFAGSSTELIRLKSDDTLGQTDFKMITSATDNSWATLEVSGITQPIKILFSPTVIDDYYVNWGTDNSNENIPIGFRSSYGYNLTSSGQYSRSTVLEAGKIYQTEDALNGYFMTLGSTKSAQWHFSLAGEHTIMVNIPTGKYTDMDNAVYKLHNSESNPITLIPQKFKKTLVNEPAFKNWFLLYRVKDGKNQYSFNLTGNEYVSVTSSSNTKPVVVDGIKIQSVQSIIADAKAIGTVTIKKLDDTLALKVHIDIYKEKCTLDSFNCLFTKKRTLILEDGNLGKDVKYEIDNLGKGKYKIVYTLQDITKERIHQRSRILQRSSFTSRSLEYKPQLLSFTIESDNESKQLPKVIFKKNIFKDSIKTKIISAVDGSVISDASIVIKFGIDREDDAVAYDGVTDSNGLFEVEDMPYGQYSILLTKDGFISTSLNLTVDELTADITEFSMSPTLSDGEVRVRLTWGENPSDLDSHLVKKTDENEDYHIFYSNRNGTNGDNLDLDDTDGNGPETTTIASLSSNSVYTYYIHHFSGSSSIKDSSASVKVSSGTTELTFYPPNEDGEYWRVFTIENGTVNACTTDCMGTTETLMAKSPNRQELQIDDSYLFMNLPIK